MNREGTNRQATVKSCIFYKPGLRTRNIQSYQSDNIQLDYDIKPIPGLSANLNLGYDISVTVTANAFNHPLIFAVAADTGEIKIENYSRISQVLETYLNYKREFEGINSKIDFVAGYSWQNWNSKYPSLRATRLTDNSYGVNNPSIANKVEAFNSVLENRLISFFGRLNFSHNDRYIIRALFVRDGSTDSVPMNRWGIFPSGSVRLAYYRRRAL